MKFLRTYKAGIKDLPFLLLVNDMIWWGLSLFGIYISDYWWWSELTGHSIAFVLFMGFYAIIFRYCLYSWACIVGLGLINVLNLTHYFFNFVYIEIYAGLILMTSLTFAVIKWKNRYFTYHKL